MDRSGSSGAAEEPHASGEDRQSPQAKVPRGRSSPPNLQKGLRFRFAVIAMVALLWIMALLIHSCAREDKSTSSSPTIVAACNATTAPMSPVPTTAPN